MWLLVPGGDAPTPVAEVDGTKKPRKSAAPGVKVAGPPGTHEPSFTPGRMRPKAVAEPSTGPKVDAPPEMSPELAKARLVTLVQDLEAKAERGETLGQAEYVALYKRGTELVDPLIRAGKDDPEAQKEFGALNSRFRIAINKVQPRAP